MLYSCIPLQFSKLIFRRSYFFLVMFRVLFLSEERIRSGIKKLVKARQGSTQGRLDSFFKVLPSPSPVNKRKVKEYTISSTKYSAWALTRFKWENSCPGKFRTGTFNKETL